jgi:PLP dependent protein
MTATSGQFGSKEQHSDLVSGADTEASGGMSALNENIVQVSIKRDATMLRIEQAVAHAGRAAGSTQLLAVSKTFPAANVLTMAQTGQRLFGENYVQEACEKIVQCAALDPALSNQLIWHFIGPLQSNKTRPVAQAFDWVHSIDRAKIAQRLNEQRPIDKPALHVCVQVNVSGEASKAGCQPDQLGELLKLVTDCTRLELRGLMAIPEPLANAGLESLNQQFAHMNQLFKQYRAIYGDRFDTLSMGMSGDLEVAIEYGATMVRVGTALFGART